MLKLFRRIRQKLIQEGSLSRYLIYAIGEIALVMIGILLALQVNNWNLNQQAKKSENNALVELRAEFGKNQKRLNELIAVRKLQEEQIRSYIALIIDDDIPIGEKMNAQLPSDYDGVWGNENMVLSSLINTGAIENIQNDSLKMLLTQWPISVGRFLTYEKELRKGMELWRDYRDQFKPSVLTKKGNYSQKWPGNEYPQKILDKMDEFNSEKIESIKHYNLLSRIISKVYIYLILTKELTENYKLIIKYIDEELTFRNIKYSKSDPSKIENINEFLEPFQNN